jgi:(1->4)-alpha-D-glucan 1-alpha-D-glucosylmutase
MDNPIDRLAADTERVVRERSRVPVATYRLQMNSAFTLDDAAEITPYLESLGVSHVYTSPMTAAKPGSAHGYDVIDHGRLNPEIGSEEQVRSWIADLRTRGMGWLLDVVPNHMSVFGPNEWWADVLEHGPASPFAGHFDIAWNDHPRQHLRGKVLLPILGNPYGAEIEAGKFNIEYADGGFSIAYGSLRLPIDPRTYGLLLTPLIEAMENKESEERARNELKSILTAINHLPPRHDVDRIAEARAESRVIRRRLSELTERNAAVAAELNAIARVASGERNDPASFAKLEELLDAQVYRPCYWRVASDEINYRRFFDVNDLAALSIENEDVFVAIHRLIFDWTSTGQLDGLRIDHPDGLYDPKQYLDRLQLHHWLATARWLLSERREEYDGAPWTDVEQALRERFESNAESLLYVVVEKILGEAESIPKSWRTDGTTGYEFINVVNGIFVDRASEPAMSHVYRELTGFDQRFDDLVYVSKFHLLQSSLASELHMLAHQLDRIAQSERWSRDFTLNGLRHALREVIACFPVYRSYVNGTVGEIDRVVILRAIARGRRRNPLLGRAMFDFIRDTLLLKDPPSGPASPEYRAAQQRFAGKFQQVTSPTMAKGFEDTALYVYSRLISLNEVGGNPSQFGRSVDEAHEVFQLRADRSPAALSPLSTHDTKRSEDVRARINVLSEIPDEWEENVRKWMYDNRSLKLEADGQPVPDANDEYFLYQTLVGAWPMEGLHDDNRQEFAERIRAYFNKALHEAKVHSSWMNPNPEYDAAAAEFVGRILDPSKAAVFLQEFESFQTRVRDAGIVNSLAQSLIRITAPGVPDTYQGTELWDLSLVDPDNRRPVDFAERTRLLNELDRSAATNTDRLVQDLVANRRDGRIKLYVVSRALRYRRNHESLFGTGAYQPVSCDGPMSGHVFCFTRSLGETDVLVTVPRLVCGLLQMDAGGPFGKGGWAESELILPEPRRHGRARDVFTGRTLRITARRRVRLDEVFGVFPIALLEFERE